MTSAADTSGDLYDEVLRLRRLNEGLCERIAAASEVLTRVAQKLATAEEVRAALAALEVPRG